LRFELAKHGYPILGDMLYGAEKTWTNGIALRSFRLEFLSPEFEKWKLPRKLEIQKI